MRCASTSAARRPHPAAPPAPAAGDQVSARLKLSPGREQSPEGRPALYSCLPLFLGRGLRLQARWTVSARPRKRTGHLENSHMCSPVTHLEALNTKRLLVAQAAAVRRAQRRSSCGAPAAAAPPGPNHPGRDQPRLLAQMRELNSDPRQSAEGTNSDSTSQQSTLHIRRFECAAD